MSSFKKSVYQIIEKSHQLSLGDKLLINTAILKFSTDWKKRTGRKPSNYWVDIAMIAPLLRDLGFTMLDVDNWEWEDIKPYLMAKK